jgi:two-component system sensor histidine kinase KdpD
MTELVDEGRALSSPVSADQRSDGRLPLLARYGAALGLVAVATLLAFVVEHLIAAPNLTLIFVLPVVIAATTLGFAPSFAAVIASVLAFDFFFTQPYYSFTIANASDVWAAALLFVTAVIVSTVAGDARRRALEARLAAAQDEALQRLAHVVIEARSREEVVSAAAGALQQIFKAPALIFMDAPGGIRLAASAGGVQITNADEEAAQGALDAGVRTRGETFPYDRTEFDFWPLILAAGSNCVLGVNFKRSGLERPPAPERFIEIVGGYLATALGGRRTLTLAEIR